MLVQPTDSTLGAVATDVLLAELTAAQWAELEAAFHRHAVLIFPGQHLDEADQVAFGRRFGELSIEILLLSNVGLDGATLALGDPMTDLLRGNEGWHTDSSFKRLAAKASILSAVTVPSAGGETEWADMRAAHDALPPAEQKRLAGLAARHSLVHSQARIGASVGATAAAVSALAYRSASGDQVAPVADPPTRKDPLRPLVKVHPVTGRPALFIGRHAYGVTGLAEDESERLLTDLLDEACQPPRVLQHRWQPGDVVIWDNRCVLHRARPYDRSEPRVMVHTRVAGDPASELADA